jgi:hypothetical protein
MRLAILILTLLIASLHGYSQQQVILNPVKDNTLYETTNGTTSNGAGDFLFIGRIATNGGGAKRRAVLKFDVASNIPVGALITSAVLTMHMSKTISGTQNASLYKLFADWGEGTSNAGSNEGSGASATTGDATWIHRFFNTTNWTTVGGDFSTINSANTNVSGIGNESTTGTAKRFDSRENSTLANRPKLTITFTTATSVNENKSVPSEMLLQQNFPNPFNPSTTITYHISEHTNVLLRVFDILGREVMVLVNQDMTPGTYHSVFNASNLPSGVYFYQISTASETSTRTMIISK